MRLGAKSQLVFVSWTFATFVLLGWTPVGHAALDFPVESSLASFDEFRKHDESS